MSDGMLNVPHWPAGFVSRADCPHVASQISDLAEPTWWANASGSWDGFWLGRRRPRRKASSCWTCRMRSLSAHRSRVPPLIASSSASHTMLGRLWVDLWHWRDCLILARELTLRGATGLRTSAQGSSSGCRWACWRCWRCGRKRGRFCQSFPYKFHWSSTLWSGTHPRRSSQRRRSNCHYQGHLGGPIGRGVHFGLERLLDWGSLTLCVGGLVHRDVCLCGHGMVFCFFPVDFQSLLCSWGTRWLSVLCLQRQRTLSHSY